MYNNIYTVEEIDTLIRLGVEKIALSFSAIYDSAYITASIALTAALIELLASIYLPNEHIHFKGIISDVHEKCEDDLQEKSK